MKASTWHREEKWSQSPTQVSVLTCISNALLESLMTLWGDGNDHYFDLGNGYTDINMCQNPSVCARKIQALYWM